MGLQGPHPPLSLALAGLTVRTGLRAQVEWAAEMSRAGGESSRWRGVQLNAAGETKPRDMGRSARRDLTALLRRHELGLSGVDLWIPPAHFTDPALADRALGAVNDAIDFTAELAALMNEPHAVLSLELPRAGEGESVARPLAERAASRGVVIADHAWPPGDLAPGERGCARGDHGTPIRVGLDPAAIFLTVASGEGRDGEWLKDPARAASHLGDRVASARLTDLGAAGRVPAGTGRLDVLAYLVALSTAGYAYDLVVDFRGIARQEQAARELLV